MSIFIQSAWAGTEFHLSACFSLLTWCASLLRSCSRRCKCSQTCWPSLRSGKRDSGSILQIEIPLSLRFAWKKGSDWSSHSSSCNSGGCSLTVAERGSMNNAIRGCMVWKSWKQSFNCCCSVWMSALYLRNAFSHLGTSLRISSQAGKCAKFGWSDEKPSSKHLYYIECCPPKTLGFQCAAQNTSPDTSRGSSIWSWRASVNPH